MQLSVILKDLVLIGGGHSHVHTIRSFGMAPMPGVRVTLISKDVETPYSGMIPGYVAGHYTREQCHIDLLRLCSASKVRFIKAEACGLDPVKREILCADNRPPIAYDVTSIDVGITPKLPFSTSLLDSVTPVKPIDGFCDRWDKILSRVIGSKPLNRSIRIAIVGGGAGGVELCFAIHHRVKEALRQKGHGLDVVEVQILSRGSQLMQSHNERVQRIVLRLMRERGIHVRLGTHIVGVERSDGNTVLIAEDGSRVECDEAVWCTSATAQSWIGKSGLDVTEEGFIRVADTLESVNTRDVFACGDVAHFVDSPRPKAGVFAVRAGPPLTSNLRRRLSGQPLVPWTPQTQFLGIIGAGDHYAIASRGPLAIESAQMWTLKDYIDNTWMDGYRGNLSAMIGGMQSSNMSITNLEISEEARRTLDSASMRCGGCGSKIGSTLLNSVLKRLRSTNLIANREEVRVGIGKDAAIISSPPAGTFQVQTVDYFRAFISDSFVFGQIAAVHALSDIYAMNGEAISALATCVVPFGIEEKVKEELLQLLAGVCHALKQENCALVGGHSSEGMETALGISAYGVVEEGRGSFEYKAKVGDKLVLTKPIGTGTILAADMRGKAKGKWVWAALQSMMQSNRKAAKILFDSGCQTCTDITGFGLIGHISQLMQGRSDGHIVKISLNDLPLLAGAIECIESGALSSLQDEVTCHHRQF